MRKLQLFAFRISFSAPVFQGLRLSFCRRKLGVIHRDIHRCGKSVWNGKTKAAYTMFSVENGDKRFRGRATHWVRRVQRGQRGVEGARSGPPHIIALALSTTAEAGVSRRAEAARVRLRSVWLIEASSSKSKLIGGLPASAPGPPRLAGRVCRWAGLSRPGAAWSPQGRAQRLTGGGPVASVRLGRLIRRRIPQGGGAVYT